MIPDINKQPKCKCNLLKHYIITVSNRNGYEWTTPCPELNKCTKMPNCAKRDSVTIFHSIFIQVLVILYFFMLQTV